MESKGSVLVRTFYRWSDNSEYNGSCVIEIEEWVGVQEAMKWFFLSGGTYYFDVTKDRQCSMYTYSEWIECLESNTLSAEEENVLGNVGLLEVGNTAVLDEALEIYETYKRANTNEAIERVLVETRYNWADEIDFSGCIVIPLKEYEDVTGGARIFFNGERSLTFYVGSNEDIELCNLRDWERCITVRPITQDQYVGLRALKLLRIGAVKVWDCMVEQLYDEGIIDDNGLITEAINEITT